MNPTPDRPDINDPMREGRLGAALAEGLWSGLSAALVFDRSFELLMLGLSGSTLARRLFTRLRR